VEVTDLLADVAPDFIQLDTLAIEAAHFLVKQASTALTDANTQAHDRVTVNPGHSLYDRIELPSARAAVTAICLSLLRWLLDIGSVLDGQ